MAVQSRSRALSYYWPVYAWGLQTPFGFVSNITGCGPGPSDAAGFISLMQVGWAFLLVSACVVCCVIAVGVALQYLFFRLAPTSNGAPVGVPLPIFAAVFGVLGLQAAFIALILSWAPGART